MPRPKKPRPKSFQQLQREHNDLTQIFRSLDPRGRLDSRTEAMLDASRPNQSETEESATRQQRASEPIKKVNLGTTSSSTDKKPLDATGGSEEIRKMYGIESDDEPVPVLSKRKITKSSRKKTPVKMTRLVVEDGRARVKIPASGDDAPNIDRVLDQVNETQVDFGHEEKLLDTAVQDTRALSSTIPKSKPNMTADDTDLTTPTARSSYPSNKKRVTKNHAGIKCTPAEVGKKRLAAADGITHENAEASSSIASEVLATITQGQAVASSPPSSAFQLLDSSSVGTPATSSMAIEPLIIKPNDLTVPHSLPPGKPRNMLFRQLRESIVTSSNHHMLPVEQRLRTYIVDSFQIDCRLEDAMSDFAEIVNDEEALSILEVIQSKDEIDRIRADARDGLKGLKEWKDGFRALKADLLQQWIVTAQARQFNPKPKKYQQGAGRATEMGEVEQGEASHGGTKGDVAGNRQKEDTPLDD